MVPVCRRVHRAALRNGNEEEEMMSPKWLGHGLAVLAALGLATSAGAQSDEGVKQIETLVKASGNTVKAIAETKQQLQKTMDVYNSLMADGAQDLPKLYKDLQKQMEDTQKRREKIKQEAATMSTEAEALFTSWSASAAAIENPDLRKKSEDRLAKTKASYEQIGKAGDKASDLYDPFMKALQDQVTYLGHDLNADALASLKPEAQKINQEADKLMKSIDDTITTANTNIGALNPK
jgi:ElaB/YqjD/DUF883 family membrane-anchored ribosome-binding protein